MFKIIAYVNSVNIFRAAIVTIGRRKDGLFSACDGQLISGPKPVPLMQGIVYWWRGCGNGNNSRFDDLWTVEQVKRQGSDLFLTLIPNLFPFDHRRK